MNGGMVGDFDLPTSGFGLAGYAYVEESCGAGDPGEHLVDRGQHHELLHPLGL